MSSGKNFSSEAKALFELPFSTAAAIPLPPPSLYLQLVPAKDRELFRAYIFYLFLLLRRGMHRRGLHPKSFNLLYRAVSRTWPGRTLLGFCKRNLSPAIFPCRCCWNRWTVLNGCLKTVIRWNFPPRRRFGSR